jgi:hypothetical protein
LLGIGEQAQKITMWLANRILWRITVQPNQRIAL